MRIDEILNALVILLNASNPYKIILFGSYANDGATEDSDIDLMVILDNNNIALNILVYSKGELKLIKENGNCFIDEIEQTGKVLYEKASWRLGAFGRNDIDIQRCME